MKRVDSASRVVAASPGEVYRAFTDARSLERWLPPGDMTGEVLHFDFREGGSYRMRLAYAAPGEGQGKTSSESDEVEVVIASLERGRRIEQEIRFVSDDPAYAGLMRMIWTFEPAGSATRVTIRAEDVPYGIRPEDHEAGLRSTLENLARFVEQGG